MTLQNFSKSILNYFATFNETRFRFDTKLSYQWTDNELTLDLSVFPDFQNEILNDLISDKFNQYEITQGKYTIKLDNAEFLELLQKSIKENYTQEYLTNCINIIKEEKIEKEKQFIVNKQGQSSIKIDEDEINKIAYKEGCRNYNLGFRKEVGKILLKMQENKRAKLANELQFQCIPITSFNPKMIEQKIFDDFSKFIEENSDVEKYFESLHTYIKTTNFELVMYDLYSVLLGYKQFITTNTLNLFFHEIISEKDKFPLFSIEIELVESENKFNITSFKNIFMLNTPAINSFQFQSVLTTPRAASISESSKYILILEKFFQAYYKINNNFLSESQFKAISADNLPAISFRIGLQITQDLDRRILDYSELITNIDVGAGDKFNKIINKYVEGQVYNTSDEVHSEYIKEFPKKSVNNLISTIPLKLNHAQKKIVTAVRNEKNEIIVVDGPPGTGKSYTITAIIYLANQLNKSVLVTSHKKQALDVIEDKITDEFKKLHPNAKPSILRLLKGSDSRTINDINTTLSNAVLNTAKNRVYDFPNEAIEKDKEKLIAELEKQNKEYWEQLNHYEELTKKTLELSRIEEELNLSKEIIIADIKYTNFNIDEFVSLAKILENYPENISFENFIYFYNINDDLPKLIQKCEKLNTLNKPIKVAINNKLDNDKLNRLESLIEYVNIAIKEGTLFSEINFDDITINIGLNDNLKSIKNYDDFLKIYQNITELYQINKNIVKKFIDNKRTKELKNNVLQISNEISVWIKVINIKEIYDIFERTNSDIEKVSQTYKFLKKSFIFQEQLNNSLSQTKDAFVQITSLEFAEIIKIVTEEQVKPITSLSLQQLLQTVQDLIKQSQYTEISEEISNFSEKMAEKETNLVGIYSKIKQIHQVNSSISEQQIKEIEIIFTHYHELFLIAGINTDNIQSLWQITKDNPINNNILNYINNHTDLCSMDKMIRPDNTLVDDYLLKVQKQLEHKNDERQKNLLNHTRAIQKIINSVLASKRINTEEATILFSSLSCIISEPKLISQFFPMEEDLIDILIIDEASQVSIAQSLSLILRAKQTIVFGDELQYGAVGAQNVNQKYSIHYYKDLLDNYSKDKNAQLSEAEKEQIAKEVSQEVKEEDEEVTQSYLLDPGTKEWLKTFSIRTSTLAFCKALANYSDSLDVHFRSFPEIISYSNDYFYKPSQINLITNRIRTKPINDVLRFIKVETKGLCGANINLDEIEAIKQDIEILLTNNYKGSIGIICSFREQTSRMEEVLKKELKAYPKLLREHKFKIWFVGEVQGEERDIIYYSFVQDKKIDNADLKTIYPINDGVADNIRKLKKQRLNVGFSRAKDTMVFVHSMPIADYSDTALGISLKHYVELAKTTNDHYVSDEDIFESPAEKELYSNILQTDFFRDNKSNLKITAQFEIGKYIKDTFHRYLPKYRVDFLLTVTKQGKEQSLIIEYDGLEFHTKNPDIVTAYNFDEEYLEYDKQRQLELESYGYKFLRINKYTLRPTKELVSKIEVLSKLLDQAFI